MGGSRWNVIDRFVPGSLVGQIPDVWHVSGLLDRRMLALRMLTRVLDGHVFDVQRSRTGATLPRHNGDIDARSRVAA